MVFLRDFSNNFSKLNILGVREMRKSISMLSGFMVAVAALTSGACFAEEFAGANAANGKTIFTQGKGDAQACVTCHGDNAQGNDAMGAPRLANIGYPYVVKQLTDLASDQRTPGGVGAVMPVFAKALSEQDRRDVAAYVNSLETAPELSDLKAIKADGQVPVGEAYLGQVLVKYGVEGKAPACQSCHGYNGRGAAPIFPAIGQQKYVYLVHQLKNWRANEADISGGAIARTNDPKGMMRAVAKNLTDEDIYNAATYLSAAPRTTEGNARVPEVRK
jgi:cytochrome c553